MSKAVTKLKRTNTLPAIKTWRGLPTPVSPEEWEVMERKRLERDAAEAALKLKIAKDQEEIRRLEVNTALDGIRVDYLRVQTGNASYEGNSG